VLESCAATDADWLYTAQLATHWTMGAQMPRQSANGTEQRGSEEAACECTREMSKLVEHAAPFEQAESSFFLPSDQQYRDVQCCGPYRWPCTLNSITALTIPLGLSNGGRVTTVLLRVPTAKVIPRTCAMTCIRIQTYFGRDEPELRLGPS